MIFADHIDLSKAIIQQVRFPQEFSCVSVFVKQIDLIHPLISGNK